MSDLRLVYLSGEPGIGKSTLMARITDPWQRYPQPPTPGAPARDLLVAHARPDPDSDSPAPRSGPVAVELGRHRDHFGGTDALPSAVIGAACAYLDSGQAATEAPLLLAEGARLANRRFLTRAVDAGWQVTLVHLYGTGIARARRHRRAEQLARPPQNESWVKGRHTAAVNLVNGAPSWGVEVLTVNVALDDGSDLVRLVRGWAGA